MAKKFLYFQPEYVRNFKCDGSKCDARCCKNWQIDIDAATYEQYSRIKPASDAQKILAHIKFNPKAHTARQKYFVEMDAEKICPFLNENNLCRLQLTYGEKFLSNVCASFPRSLFDFGKFFERSLTLTCPVAAELILFHDEPMKFEFVELCKDDAKAVITPVKIDQRLVQRIPEAQIAMISILQERTLSIDQRLIVLGFFIDKLDEIFFDVTKEDALIKLTEAYESKSFLSEQVSHMLKAVTFDAKKFIGLTIALLEKIFGGANLGDNEKFLDALIETLKIFPDEHNRVSVAKIADNYVRLADARKKFLARYSTFLENFLVNELFLTCFPWNVKARFAKNFGVFVASYKLFELFTFAAVQKNLCDKGELLRLVDWRTNQANRIDEIIETLLKHFANEDDVFSLAEIFLDGRFERDGTNFAT